MTFNEGADISGNRVRRGSKARTGGVAAGGIGGIGLIVYLLMQLFGGGGNVDLSGLTGTDQAEYEPPGGESYVECTTGQDANENIECRMQATALSLDAFWSEALPAQAGIEYVPPPFQLFSQATATGCGDATSAVGPFYCPGDRQVYLDLSFFREMETRFAAAGDFAQAYVIAHEVGHHVQTLLGVSARVNAARQRGERVEGDNGLLVRQELQADCLAGVWAHHAQQRLNWLEPGDLEEALNAANAIGDDRLQKQSRGTVMPDSFTHGTSAQRVRWFRNGFDNGEPGRCDTFKATKL